jgi:hypothetical protein
MKNVRLNQISTWIHKNARELELAIWKYHFEDGSKEEVVKALMYYQKEDGGFGDAVDPDNWNINSSPYATLFVIKILEDIEFFQMQHPIYIGIKKYLDNEDFSPKGWTFTIPTNNEHPHASFHHYSDDYNKVESTGIILGFCSFIIEHNKDSRIYQVALTLIDEYMNKLYSDDLGDMGPGEYVTLIHTMKKLNIKGYDYPVLELRLKELVNQSMQRNPEQWQYYGYRPSDYIKSETSIFYQDNKDIVEVELDYLYDTLPNDDIWPISWSWFDYNDTYPKEHAIGENWWKAIKGIQRAIFLKNFGRLS